MKKLYIKSALSEGWSQFMKRPWYLLGLTLAFAGLFVTVSSESSLATALAYILSAGYTALLLRHYAGDIIKFDDLFDVDGTKWVSFAFLAVIKGVLILLGFLCFIVPGVYLLVRWVFAEFYVIDKGMRPLEALKASSKLTEGHRWPLFWFICVALLLVMVGLIGLIIGGIIAGIVTTFALIKIYKDLQVVEVTTEHVQG